jgi:hypothetical protein
MQSTFCLTEKISSTEVKPYGTELPNAVRMSLGDGLIETRKVIEVMYIDNNHVFHCDLQKYIF